MIKKGDVALRINTTIYCVDFYFLKQYIVYVNQDLNNFKILKISNSFYLKLNI